MGYPSYFENIVERLQASFINPNEGSVKVRGIGKSRPSAADIERIVVRVLDSALPKDLVEYLRSNSSNPEFYYKDQFAQSQKTVGKLIERADELTKELLICNKELDHAKLNLDQKSSTYKSMQVKFDELNVLYERKCRELVEVRRESEIALTKERERANELIGFAESQRIKDISDWQNVTKAMVKKQ